MWLQVYCGPGFDFRDKVCISDEHYLATLLAVYGQHESRSHALQPLTFAFFSDKETHPFTFQPGDTAAGLRAMKCRFWDGCAAPVLGIASELLHQNS